MKKALIALVAIAVAVGFAYSVMAAETGDVKVKEKEKVKAIPGGTQTTTKEKAVQKTGTPGHMSTHIVTLQQISDNKPADLSDNTITFLTEKNEKLTLKAHQNLVQDANKYNALKNNLTKTVKLHIESTYPVTPGTLTKDGIITGFEPVTPTK